MEKLIFFAPTKTIEENARRIAREENRDVTVRLVSTESCVAMAQAALEQGARVIIARGTQAQAIRRETTAPVVEVALTAQEMGLAVQKAKGLLGTEKPRLAVVGYRNMFCDMRHFDQLFGIELLEYYVGGTEELPDGVKAAKRDGADLVIGGEIVCQTAEGLGMPALLQPHGEDSIRQAFRVASSVLFAAEQEQKTISELNTLLDFSFSGLVKLDTGGTISALNSRACDMFGQPAAALVGQGIDTAMPGLFAEYLRPDVLEGGKDIFTVVRMPKLVAAVGASPILVEGRAEGCILSCHEVNRLTEMEIEARREMRQGAEAPADVFEEYFTGDAYFMRTLRHYAKFNSPVLLAAQGCTPLHIPARLLHGESLRGTKPFCAFTPAGLPAAGHAEALFGTPDSPGLLHKATGGTLFLDGVENLDKAAQARLCALLTGGEADPNFKPGAPPDVRLVAGSAANLWQLAENGGFDKSLYYLLSTLVLPLPALDAERWAPVFVQRYCNRHFRYLHLAKSARAAIAGHPWQGLLELDRFCERLVITAPGRTADGATVARMLERDGPAANAPARFAQNQEAARLAEVLERYEGSRALAAEALGISKTTLWRRMKRLGLYDDGPVD